MKKPSAQRILIIKLSGEAGLHANGPAMTVIHVCLFHVISLWLLLGVLMHYFTGPLFPFGQSNMYFHAWRWRGVSAWPCWIPWDVIVQGASKESCLLSNSMSAAQWWDKRQRPFQLCSWDVRAGKSQWWPHFLFRHRALHASSLIVPSLPAGLHAYLAKVFWSSRTKEDQNHVSGTARGKMLPFIIAGRQGYRCRNVKGATGKNK